MPVLRSQLDQWLLIGQRPDDGHFTGKNDQAHQQGRGTGQRVCPPDRQSQHGWILATNGVTNKCLGGMGIAIKPKRDDPKHYDHSCAAASSMSRTPHCSGKWPHRRAASKCEGSNQLRVKKLAKSWQIKPGGVAREQACHHATQHIVPLPANETEGEDESQPLRRDRGQCNAVYLHSKANDKQDVEQQITDIDDNDLHHAEAHLLSSEQASKQNHIPKSGRCG